MDENVMRLRPAGPSDLDILRYWDTKPHVIAAGGVDDLVDWETELRRAPAWREMLIAEEVGRAIGLIQIIDPAEEETRYWGDVEPDLRAIDIWIGEESDLGRGYGSEMMRLALARCFAEPRVKAVLIDPLTENKKAIRFYERLGFSFVERRIFGSDDCFVYRLDRAAWDDRQSTELLRPMPRPP